MYNESISSGNQLGNVELLLRDTKMSEFESNVCNFVYKDKIYHGAKISDLIAKLQQIQQVHGDLDIYVVEGDGYYDDFLNVDNLHVSQVVYTDENDWKHVIEKQKVLAFTNH